MGKGAWSSYIVTFAMLSGIISAEENRLFDPWNNSFYYDASPDNGWQFGVGGSYLYFKARQDGLAIAPFYDLGSPPYEGAGNIGTIAALPIPETGFTLSNNLINQKNLKLQPYYQNGFRVFADVLLPCTDINMHFSYSYYNTKASHTWNSVATPNPFATFLDVGTIIPKTIIYGVVGEFAPVPLSTMTSELNGYYTLRIQDFELAFSYPIKWGQCFTFSPTIGLKGILIDQTLSFNDQLTIITTTTIDSIYESINQRSRFYSFGLEGGFKAEYAIGKGVSAFGNLGFALVYGQRKLTGSSEILLGGSLAPLTGSFGFDQQPNVLRPCVDSGFGFRYVTEKFFNAVKGSIAISWEQHLYFKQNFFLDSIDFRNSENNNLSLGDLSTYGLVLSGELLF